MEYGDLVLDAKTASRSNTLTSRRHYYSRVNFTSQRVNIISEKYFYKGTELLRMYALKPEIKRLNQHITNL